MASSIFNSIKETILGVKSNNIDHIIDKSLENISLYSSNSDNNKFIEAMKNIVSSAGLDKNNSVVSQLDKGMPRVQNYDQSGRVARYGEYDAICSKISYVQRALQVRTDHIIAPDDVLKHSIQVIPFDRDSKDRKVDIAKTRIVEFCRHFKLENKIKKLVFDTLKYGDNFVEIVPTPKGKNALVVINEGVDYTAFRKLEKLCEFTDTLKITEPVYDNNHSEIIDNKEVSNTKFKIVIDEASDGLTTKKILNEALSINMGGTLTGLTPDIYQAPFSNAVPIDTEPLSKDDHPVGKVNDDKFKSKYSNETNIDDKKEDDNLLQLKDISIVFHEPKYIIRLETQRFKVCLGYLVFPKVDPTTMLTGNMNTNIDSICANFLSTVETKLGIKTEHDKIRISDDIKNVLLAHLKKIKNNEDLKVRYVAPEFMEHFRINVSKYAPYGESILDSSLYDAKLLMALKTAATIKKINACSDKRFVSVEVGLPRDAKNVVSKMEEMLTKKRISIGSFGNIDSIPSQISSFETIFIPMKDGKKYVEVDHQNWGGDTSNDTENIKNMRDSIIGNLGVPAPFVNIDESTSNRSSLTTESINFLRTIIDDQKELSIPLHELICKIYRLVYGDQEADILDKIQVTFNEPKALPNSLQAEYIETMQRVIQALGELGMPKDYLKKQYLPNIDWDKVQKAAASEKLDMELNDGANNGMGMDMIPGGIPMSGGMPGAF